MKDLKIDKIKNDILGKRYELSVVFVSRDKIRFLNKKYRRKNEATEILSFDLSNPSLNSRQAGEIFICREVVKTKAKKFNMTLPEYLLFLVIHGSLHLKGFRHGVKMNSYELAYYSRYRRRYL